MTWGFLQSSEDNGVHLNRIGPVAPGKERELYSVGFGT